MFKSKLWHNKYFHYFLIFSILLHIILYFLFFNVSFRKHSIAMVRGLLDSLSLSPTERQKRMQKHQELIKRLQELRQPRDNGLPAKLKPRKSDFGWVFFNDEPSAATADHVQVPTTEEGEVAQAPTPHATELVPEKPEMPAASVPVTQPPTQPKVHIERQQVVTPTPLPRAVTPPVAQPAIEHKAPQPIIPKLEAAKLEQPKPHEPVRPHIEKKAQKPRSRLLTEKQLKKELKRSRATDTQTLTSLIDELRNEPAEELEVSAEQRLEDQENAQAWNGPDPQPQPSPEIQARIDRIAHMQDQVAHYGPVPTAPSTMAGGLQGKGEGRVATAKVRGARAINNKGGRSIIALTKGFVENIKNEGEDDIERDGDPNKRPSFEEMKYISYESNINWCLQAAWKQNFYYSHNPNIREGKAVIEFTINEKGRVTQSELLQSSGYRELDSVIMKNLEFSSPFPPLPKHFGVKNYTTGRIIHVFCNRFGM